MDRNRDETGCGSVGRVRVRSGHVCRRLGFRLGLLCRRHQRKEHSSKSDWSSRESSLFGETLGGDLGRLGYGEIRVAEEGRAGIAVAVGVWE